MRRMTSGSPSATHRRARPSKQSWPIRPGWSKSSSPPRRFKMVSIAALGDARQQLTEGLTLEDSARVQEVLDFVSEAYGERTAASGESALAFSLGVAGTLAYLRS